jgi:hypothetical protein
MRRILDSIAIVDLDGPSQIIDTTARAEEAERRVQAHFETKGEPVPAPDTNAYKAIFYDRDAFYDESLLHLDCLNPGAEMAITRLREAYSDLYILTSRPDFLGRQTMIWLKDRGIELIDEEIRFKLYQIGEDKREQFTSTASWKSTIIYQAAWTYQQVLFVDDDERNRQAVAALKMLNITIKDNLSDFVFDDGPIIV